MIFNVADLGFFVLRLMPLASFHQVSQQILEQHRAEVLVHQMQGEPVTIVAVVEEEPLEAAREVRVGHSAKVASAQPLDSDQHEDPEHVDNDENQENDKPDVKEDENLFIDDVLRKKAQRVPFLNVAGVSEFVEEAFGLRWEEPGRVLRECDQVVAEQSRHCGPVFHPKAVEHPLHDGKVENLWEDFELLCKSESTRELTRAKQAKTSQTIYLMT